MKVNFTKNQFKMLLQLMRVAIDQLEDFDDAQELPDNFDDYVELYEYINELAEDFGFEVDDFGEPFIFDENILGYDNLDLLVNMLRMHNGAAAVSTVLATKEIFKSANIMPDKLIDNPEVLEKYLEAHSKYYCELAGDGFDRLFLFDSSGMKK